MLKNDLEISNEFRVKNDIANFTYAPIISDFNNNGLIDVSLISENGDIHVYEWNSPYKSNKMEWPEAQRDMFNSKRYDPPALSGELAGNTTWSGIVRVSGDIIIPQSTTLTIDPGTRIIFQHGDDEKNGESAVMPELIVRGTLNGNGAVNNRVEMYSYSKWHGIVVDPYGTINLNYCFIDRAEKGVYIKSNTEPGGFTNIIENCKISRCVYGIYIVENDVEVHDCDIHNNDYAIYALSADLTFYNNSIYENRTGIYLYESQFNIYDNTVESNQLYGMYLSNSSEGYITNNLMNLNSGIVTEHDEVYAAIFLYNSSPFVLSNHIYSNYKNGILLMNNSFPVIQENNLIEDNGPVEVGEEPFWKKAEILCRDYCAPFMSNGHNDIVDNRPNAGYLIMHAGEIEERIDVTGNYWGGSSPAGRLYPEDYFYFDNWDTEPNVTGEPSGRDGEEQLYVDGLSAEEQGDFSLAKTKYNQVISQYPDSIETAYALPRLIICEKELGGDLLQLENFYTTFSQNINDTSKSKIANNLSRRCEVQQMLYNDAIVGYEQIVQSPPTLSDSVYAVIDIGDVYVLQDELANNGTLPKLVSNSIPENPELKPKDQKKFDKKKEELLALLYNSGIKERTGLVPKEYTLSQNYPNPFNPVTIIKYQLPKASKVKLEIFNILGQKVKTLINDQKEAAYYELHWNGINDFGRQSASGIYIYRLSAETLDGSKNFVKSRKMLLIR